MSERALSNPQVSINDEIIAIVPNSLSYKPGAGDKEVKAQSAGGNAITTVVTENAETKLSTVKFKLYNTKKNLQLVKDWGALYAVAIEISEEDVTESFSDCVITTEPERAVGADGDLEIEWKGAPSL